VLAVRDVLLEQGEERRGAAHDLVSCSRILFCLPACSADSPLVMSGRTPSSMSVSLSQRCGQDSEIPESLAICDGGASPLRATASRRNTRVKAFGVLNILACEDESSKARRLMQNSMSRKHRFRSEA